VLVRRVVRGLLERGETPFLHCYAANAGAIALYEKLGFRTRARMCFTILALA
jgi:predicted GNAT family acetyltransferase